MELLIIFLSVENEDHYYFVSVDCLFQLRIKTSMMWPSQNFLPYNGTIIKIKVNEWINN